MYGQLVPILAKVGQILDVFIRKQICVALGMLDGFDKLCIISNVEGRLCLGNGTTMFLNCCRKAGIQVSDMTSLHCPDSSGRVHQ